MRGRVKAVLFVLLLLPFSRSSADCPWTPRFSAQFRATALDLSLDGNYIWLATGYGAQLLAADPSGAPRILDSIAIPGATRSIRAAGNGLAYAGSGSRLFVLRREGDAIRVVRSVATAGTINDLALAGSYVFVATSAGLEQYDLFDPANPSKTSAILATSQPNVTSLAIGRNTLFAADGDSTVELFTILVPSLPQHTGVLESVARASSVHATADDLIFVSDRFGQSTDVFTGSTRIAALPLGTTSLASLSRNVHFLAGPDRTIREADISSASRIAELFEVQLAPTDGTDNVIHTMVRSGSTLYVAAGDIGLVTIDIDALSSPRPLVSYLSGATSSVRSRGDRAWFGDGTGKIEEQKIVADGLALVEERTWTAAAGTAVRDVEGDALLTSAGQIATIWTLAPATPAVVRETTFPSAIASAVLRGSAIVALLADGSVYTADGTGAPVKAAVAKSAFLARSGSSLALAEVLAEGKTVLHYYAGGDLSAAAQNTTIDGIATGGLALDASRAALFTFTGLNVVDLATGGVTAIPGSNLTIPRQIDFAGENLVAADTRSLYVYGNARSLDRVLPLPADLVALDGAGDTVVMATSEGIAAVLDDAELPSPVAAFSNTHYTDLATAGSWIYLLTREGVDVFTLGRGDAPRFRTRVRATTTVDIAANADSLFVLSANGTVTSYTTAGVPRAQMTIDEGSSAEPLAIHAVGNAVWVSVSTGCTTGQCQSRTLVLDASTLAQTADMTGSVTDLVTNGSRAYAVTTLPNEVRVLNVADALHPSVVVSAAAPASSTSIAYDAGRVYVLADKLYSFAESTLAPAGERFTSVRVDASQRTRTSGGCAIVTGRADSPQQFALPAWTAAATFDVPSSVRTFTISDGRVILLTNHSLEIWSAAAAPQPARRRAAR